MLGLKGDADPAGHCVLAYYANLVQVDRLLASATACEEEICHRLALLNGKRDLLLWAWQESIEPRSSGFPALISIDVIPVKSKGRLGRLK
jgi:hypothetical protein